MMFILWGFMSIHLFLTDFCFQVETKQLSSQHSLMYQLDHLDKEMTEAEDTKKKVGGNQKGRREDCGIVNATYCGEIINYKVPEAMTRFPMLADGLSSAALDMAYLATKGEVRQCDRSLKEVFCRNHFPECTPDNREVSWEGQSLRCSKAVSSCPEKARKFLEDNDMCNKIEKGKRALDECVKPIVTADIQFCILDSNARVSPWLRSASIEVDNILQVQFGAYETGAECKAAVSIYLCSMANHCWKQFPIKETIKRYHDLCMDAKKACAKDHFGVAMSELFLTCDKIKELKREQE